MGGKLVTRSVLVVSLCVYRVRRGCGNFWAAVPQLFDELTLEKLGHPCPYSEQL